MLTFVFFVLLFIVPDQIVEICIIDLIQWRTKDWILDRLWWHDQWGS